jgi:hypothetical protein
MLGAQDDRCADYLEHKRRPEPWSNFKRPWSKPTSRSPACAKGVQHMAGQKNTRCSIASIVLFEPCMAFFFHTGYISEERQHRRASPELRALQAFASLTSVFHKNQFELNVG